MSFPPVQPERIVCAACRHGETIVLGVRHFDSLMQARIKDANLPLGEKWEGGFMTNKMRFVTRREAWDIAQANDQICWGKDREPGPLFSEDLY